MSPYRTWLISNLLPAKFWSFAIKYAVQAFNYMPFIKDNKWTTPFQCIYKMKPDYRNLISIFSIAYVKIFRDGVKHRWKAIYQSIKCILVGNDSKLNGKLFYVPHTRSILGSSDYKLDPTHPSGPMFQLNYNWDIQFNLHVLNSNDMRPPTVTIGYQVTITNIDNDKKIATIMNIPLNNSIFIQ